MPTEITKGVWLFPACTKNLMQLRQESEQRIKKARERLKAYERGETHANDTGKEVHEKTTY